MTIIEDTNQKKGMHEIKHDSFSKMGVELIRNKLPFGDYIKVPKVSVDTKRDMQEIAYDINSDHKRFKNSCIKARDAGCQLIILVENNDSISCVDEVHNWVNPEIIYRPQATTGSRLEKAMKTMNARYGVIFEFCKPEESAQRIMELLEEYDG